MNTSTRSRRPFWGDARFLTGIALIAVSIGGVWLVVSSTGTTAPALQATRVIVEGEAVTADDFQVVEVHLGTLTDDYLAPHQLEADSIATRTIRAGELIPGTALAEAASRRSTTMVIDSSTAIPVDVAAGTVVEIWHAPPLDDTGSFDIPRILVAEAVVSSIPEPEGMLASDGTSAELVIDRADVADVLAAVTGGSALSLIPIGTTG